MGRTESLPDNGDENLAVEYIKSLRRYIGHAPVQMVGAAVLLLDDQDRLLLLERSDSGCWGPPGGAVEMGEAVEAAARRETREETGLEVGEMSLYGVFSGPEYYYKYPNGDEVYNISIIFVSRNWKGTVQLNGEHRSWRWFVPAGIPTNISPPILPILTRFVEEYASL